MVAFTGGRVTSPSGGFYIAAKVISQTTDTPRRRATSVAFLRWKTPACDQFYDGDIVSNLIMGTYRLRRYALSNV